MKENAIESNSNEVVLDVIDSTNEYMLRLIRGSHKLQSGFIVTAQSQDRGKGQHGRFWCSPRGNLYCSMYFCINTNSDLLNIPLYISEVIKNSLEDLGILNLKIKEPNDVYYKESKLSGVLIETIIQGDIVNLVIGFGLNIISTQSYGHLVEKKITSIEEICKEQKIKSPGLTLVKNKITENIRVFYKNNFV